MEKSDYVEHLNAPNDDDEHSKNSEQQNIESDHEDVAVHVVDEIQSEGEKEKENHQGNKLVLSRTVLYTLT